MENIINMAGSLMTDLIGIYFKSTSVNFENLMKIAELYGIPSSSINVFDGESVLVALQQKSLSQNLKIVLDVESLKEAEGLFDVEELNRFFNEQACAVLVLASCDDPATARFLGRLTGGGIDGIEYAENLDSVAFLESAHRYNRELSGETYRNGSFDGLIFSINEERSISPIMASGDKPSFVLMESAKYSLFVWAALRVIDVSQTITSEREFESVPEKFLPAIIFLKAVFKDSCWHNPNSGAGIILDDPLLKKRYGFVDFPALLNSAHENGFRITLAYIPWNYWRSRVKDAQFFLKNHDCFSICVHGCDHTGSEYGSNSYEQLLLKTSVAIERLRRQRRRTGLNFEHIMVFPQGKFSIQAMRALYDNGQMLAAINSTCLPTHLPADQVCLADFMLPALDCFSGFPIFKRRSSENSFGIAMDLFLGKPAFMVAHHDDFQDGYSKIKDFYSICRQPKEAVSWKPISETLKETHLRKQSYPNKTDIRFFTNIFRLVHKQDEPWTYSFFRKIPAESTIQSVYINNKLTPFSRDSAGIRFDLRVEAPATYLVHTNVASKEVTKKRLFGLKYQVKVAARRALSEFRDNVIYKNHFAMNIWRATVRTLKQSS